MTTMMLTTSASSSVITIIYCIILLVPSTALSVWDGVIGADQQMALHRYASKVGLEHKCFSRPLDSSSGNNNIIELTLDAILKEIERKDQKDEGKKQYVEYWTRQEWRHIEAHSDVDEALAKVHDQNPSLLNGNDLEVKFPSTFNSKHRFRYPLNGHVLYLQVGSEVKGPTCVFPSRSSGGDLLQNSEDEDDACDTEDRSHDKKEDIKLVTVPAVSGRLLRFDGQDLHAVPRPHDIWMLPFVKGGAEYKPEEVWGRSVILFNVWPGEEEPPLNVPLDNNDVDEGGTSTAYNDLCSVFSDWEEVDTVTNEEIEVSDTQESNQSVKVWLLGNEKRRGYPMRTVNLLSPEHGGRESLRKALSEKSSVTELLLRRQ